VLNYYTNFNGFFHSSESITEKTLWINVEKPTSEEIELLRKTFSLPTDYLTDILDDDENSRFESGKDVPNLLLLQYPALVKDGEAYSYVETFPLALILTTDGKILTVGNHPTSFIPEILRQHFAPEDIVDHLLYEIMFQLAKSFNSYLKSLKTETSQLEHELLLTTENKQLYQMIEAQKSLVLLEAALEANVEVLNKVYKSMEIKGRTLESKLYDIIVESQQALTTTRIQMKLLENISDMFSSIVSNNLNNVMKILTSLTIVLTIPTIVGGIYGMNVKLPFEDNDYAFFIVLGLTIVFCFAVIRILKKKNML
jgi:magnesium transporter